LDNATRTEKGRGCLVNLQRHYAEADRKPHTQNPHWRTKTGKEGPYLNRIAKVRGKKAAWKEYMYRRSPTDVTLQNFTTRSRNELREMTRKQKSDFEDKLATEVKENPKDFLSYARRCTSIRQDIPYLREKSGRTVNSCVDKANALADHFMSVFTNELPGNLPAVLDNIGDPMPEMVIARGKIVKSLKILTLTKL
jgi:hypothetical protein